MMCAGLKKWAPMTRSWDLVLEPMSSMSMVEVLVDNMQSGPHTLSKSAATVLAGLQYVHVQHVLAWSFMPKLKTSQLSKGLPTALCSAAKVDTCTSCVTRPLDEMD